MYVVVDVSVFFFSAFHGFLYGSPQSLFGLRLVSEKTCRKTRPTSAAASVLPMKSLELGLKARSFAFLVDGPTKHQELEDFGSKFVTVCYSIFLGLNLKTFLDFGSVHLGVK